MSGQIQSASKYASTINDNTFGSASKETSGQKKGYSITNKDAYNDIKWTSDPSILYQLANYKQTSAKLN